jgi:hypothetical protein
MDPHGHIYEMTDNTAEQREDAARLDGYLRARAEHDRKKRKRSARKNRKKHGRQ